MKYRTKKAQNIIGFFAATSASLFVILISIHIWEMDLNVPLSNQGGDGVLALTIFKSIYDYGLKGLYFCKSLGAPDIAAFVETPFIDTDLAIEVSLLSKLLPNANVVFYIDFFLTYVLAAASMYLLASKLTENIFIKTIISFSFAITPYHFSRQMSHLTLSHYYVIPIAIYLMILIYEEDFKMIVPSRYLNRGQHWKIIIMYTGCLMLGLSNIYYAFFGLLCMATGWIAKAIKKKEWKIFYKESVLIYTVLMGVLLGLLPKIIYTIQNGKNLEAIQRLPLESERFALKIIQLLLPNRLNRVGFLRNLNGFYTDNAFNINENLFSAMGMVASIGFIIVCCWIINRIVNTKQQLIRKDTLRMSIISLGILTVVLYSVAGGFGTFISYFVTAEIRCFNRASVVIVCMSLCALLICFNYMESILNRKVIFDVGKVCITIIVLFTAYSETDLDIPQWSEIRKESTIVKNFFEEVEKNCQSGDMIYELPFSKFPEVGPCEKMNDYEQFTPYLYTNSLRWSYGGVKGRNKAAETLFIDDGMSMLFVKNIIEAGFVGVYIDTNGYADSGKEVISFYEDTLNLTPIISEDNWLYFFKLDNIEMNEKMLTKGYYFFEQFAKKMGVDITVEEILDLASKIEKNNSEAYTILYSWIDDKIDTTDTEYYIEWLYENILSRKENDAEIEYWKEKLNDDITRKDVMKEFFESQEFRKKYFEGE